MLVYTSITKSYLPKARVLAKSVKRFHPDWKFVLLYSDNLPSGFKLEEEPFDEILFLEQLDITDWKAWAFGHSIVELCTAVKGPAAETLAQRSNVDKIMYLDPDIKVFNSLSSLNTLLDQYEILLTPHLLDAENEISAIRDNEISALKHGIYNLGFFAARTSGQGLDFIRWWAERLKLFCHDDIPGGLFTDQRWCDLAPAFFSSLHIIRDRGYNVATWNISHRPLSKDESGVFYVAGVPLRFYHFTGYDSGAGFGMLKRYATNQRIAYELWNEYGESLVLEGQGSVNKDWIYGQYENGEPIPAKARYLYRVREDLQKTFPNPYEIVEPSYNSWWKAEIAHGNISDTIELLPKSRTILKSIAKGMSSPSYGFQLVKSAWDTFKREGIVELIRKLRNY